MSSNSPGAPDSPGFHDQHKEVCYTPGSGDGVSRLCVGFEDVTTQSEAEILTEDSKQT